MEVRIDGNAALVETEWYWHYCPWWGQTGACIPTPRLSVSTNHGSHNFLCRFTPVHITHNIFSRSIPVHKILKVKLTKVCFWCTMVHKNVLANWDQFTWFFVPVHTVHILIFFCRFTLTESLFTPQRLIGCLCWNSKAEMHFTARSLLV